MFVPEFRSWGCVLVVLSGLTHFVFFTCTAIVNDVFQGSMRIFTKKLPHPDLVSVQNKSFSLLDATSGAWESTGAQRVDRVYTMKKFHKTLTVLALLW